MQQPAISSQADRRSFGSSSDCRSIGEEFVQGFHGGHM